MAVKWVDRVPTYANRMRITPENGDPYYATVERADEPTVVGTPVNAANLNAMQNENGLTANKTVYVSTTGSNSTGDGSQATPFATINKALSTIPKNLNGFTATIMIASGTYTENVYAAHFGNGHLVFSGISGDSVTVNKFEVTNSKFVEVTEISLNIQNGFFHAIASSIRVATPFTASGAVYGVYATNFSDVLFASTATINNAENYGVVSTSASKIYIATLAGSGNKMNVACTLGGVCVFGVDSSTTSGAQYFTDTGGRILGGSQIKIPNY